LQRELLGEPYGAHRWSEERRTSEKLEQEMSDLDLLLLGDVEDLLAA
jgi:hypothetical protein